MTESGSAASADCEAMIVIRPERRGGVIFRCTRSAGHDGEHRNIAEGEGWPLVENTSTFGVTVEWDR